MIYVNLLTLEGMKISNGGGSHWGAKGLSRGGAWPFPQAPHGYATEK